MAADGIVIVQVLLAAQVAEEHLHPRVDGVDLPPHERLRSPVQHVRVRARAGALDARSQVVQGEHGVEHVAVLDRARDEGAREERGGERVALHEEARGAQGARDVGMRRVRGREGQGVGGGEN